MHFQTPMHVRSLLHLQAAVPQQEMDLAEFRKKFRDGSQPVEVFLNCMPRDSLTRRMSQRNESLIDWTKGSL